MLLGTLGASVLGNILAGKGVIRAGDGAITKRQGRGIIELAMDLQSKKKGFMSPHHLTNF